MSQAVEPSPPSLAAALPRRPALTAAIFLILGIISHQWLPLPVTWLFLTISILAPVALLLRKHAWVSCSTLAVVTSASAVASPRSGNTCAPA